MKMHPYSTHQALLVAAMSATDGDIVELGGGWYSTPLVSSISFFQRRRSYTLETCQYVHDILKELESDHHSVELVEGFNFSEIGRFKRDLPPSEHIGLQEKYLNEFVARNPPGGKSGRYSVVFVDQAPGFLRMPSIRFFADKADFIITHDSEHVSHYHLEPTLSEFKSRWDFTLHSPNSVIVSNYHDCSVFRFLAPKGNQHRNALPALGERDEAAWNKQSAKIERLETEIAALRSSQRAEIARLKEEVAEARNSRAAAIGALKGQLTALTNSRSWRLTSPLRTISTRMRQLQGPR